MTLETALTRALGIAHPIIQAPMGGGNTTPPELVSAVSEAGGLGFIGAAYMSPAQIAQTAAGVRARTSRPFGINLFVPTSAPERDPALLDAAMARLAPYHAELGIAPPTPPAPRAFSFEEQLQAVLESDASVFSFTFGVLEASAMERVKQRGMFIVGTATTVEEGIILEQGGVDAIAAQGSEAGAHRGTFAAPFELAMIGTMALVPMMLDAVRVPVIASGGIMDGRGIAAALALGATAVQMGTAFLTCDECGVSNAYKETVLHAHEDETRPTRAFSGRPARGIVNRAMGEIEAGASAILPYPLQNALTRPMRNAATAQDRPEFLSLWAGQGLRMARRQRAGELVARLVRETDDAIARLADLRR